MNLRFIGCECYLSASLIARIDFLLLLHTFNTRRNKQKYRKQLSRFQFSVTSGITMWNCTL